jgi:hypothetical protein
MARSTFRPNRMINPIADPAGRLKADWGGMVAWRLIRARPDGKGQVVGIGHPSQIRTPLRRI